MIVLGAVCGLAVAGALGWRLRTANRQAVARTAHASVPGTPPKHLQLGGRTKVWSRHG